MNAASVEGLPEDSPHLADNIPPSLSPVSVSRSSCFRAAYLHPEVAVLLHRTLHPLNHCIRLVIYFRSSVHLGVVLYFRWPICFPAVACLVLLPCFRWSIYFRLPVSFCFCEANSGYCFGRLCVLSLAVLLPGSLTPGAPKCTTSLLYAYSAGVMP
ncbi:hypothetical protein CALCODRAFT_236930 [Calocera cornea HHB12733]|uniref:Uncharacterized protein n=1 Tax=Calocera cornea HHB12733 TaxID=1353952 RepID=A0A165GVV2_9BASI|nr:hypothetical protein CALCODRAFT_236930 [Calocera cornea HHB12733]